MRGVKAQAWRLTSILLLRCIHAITYHCDEIVVDEVAFHLGKLGGLKTMTWIHDVDVATINETFYIDVCEPLKFKDDHLRRGCKQGTQICDLKSEILDGRSAQPFAAIPIARQDHNDGADLDPKRVRLRTSKHRADEGLEGLRLTIGGGKYEKRKQVAVIDFLCPSSEGADPRRARRDAYDEDWDALRSSPDGAGGTVRFVSYDEDKLQLTWMTPHACEKDSDKNKGRKGSDKDRDKDDDDKAKPGKDEDEDEDDDNNKKDDQDKSSGGWGFFSWFFFLLFIGVLGYFGLAAWMNYTRHGAHGWDLIPHADTIRDIPYILSDWGRKIVGTVGGGGSRGGYTAV